MMLPVQPGAMPLVEFTVDVAAPTTLRDGVAREQQAGQSHARRDARYAGGQDSRRARSKSCR